MNVSVHGRNLKITDELEAYTRKKLDKLDRYLPNIREVRVDLSSQNTRRGENIVIAQVTIHHARGAILRSEEKGSSDIRKTIDAATDKMYRRIQRFKGKRQRKGRERFIATLEELDLAETIPDVEEFVEEYADIAEEYNRLAEEAIPETDSAEAVTEPLILRRKDTEVSPLNEAEAVEQMELLGHDFFMFFNVNTNSINVLYRRDAGGYGLLVPNIQ
jgi:putative sigma-54 modulation protein